MAINVSVQYNAGFLPDVILLLTQCYHIRAAVNHTYYEFASVASVASFESVRCINLGSGVSKTVHVDQSECGVCSFSWSWYSVQYSVLLYRIFSNQTSVPNILPWLSGLGAQRTYEQRLMHGAHK